MDLSIPRPPAVSLPPGSPPAASVHAGSLPAASAHPRSLPAASAHPGSLPAASAHPRSLPAASAHRGSLSTAGARPGSLPAASAIETLRARIARIEHGAPRPRGPALLLGPSIDAVLPAGGLTLGALHEAAGAGPDTEHGAAAALFVAGILARHPGPVLWVMEHADLFAPGLAGAGLHPDRVIYAEAGKPDAVLQAMEEGLRMPGLAGVVGEVGGRLTLTASRRLQLAAETSGTIAFALRRSRKHDDPALAEPSAAVTSWRLAALPSPPPLPHAPDTPGLGRQRWRLDLVRCRGGKPSSWIVEACDATGRLGLVADIGDGSAAPARQRFLSASGGSASRG
jgi:protein ImuA